MKLETIGSGERDLLVSYTSEAPIWKTTYRLILDQGGKPLLQGCAVVDTSSPAESSARYHRFRVEVPAGSTREFEVREEQPVAAAHGLASLSPEQILIWQNNRELPAEVESALRSRYIHQLQEQENLLAQLRTQQSRLRQELQESQSQLEDLIETLTLDWSKTASI